MTVTMQVSSDNGATWDFSCNSITGDVGAGITSGTFKSILNGISEQNIHKHLEINSK